MRTLRWLAVAAAALLVAGLPLWAQQFENVPQAQQAAAPAGAIKIGVINVQAAMQRTAEGKKAAEELEARFGPRQQELQKLQEDMRALQDRLRSQERTLSDDARAQIVRDLEIKQKQGTRLQEDLQEDVQDAQSEAINRIGSKMQQVIDRYAREKALNVIFNVSPGGPIIYATAAVDITEDIVKLYDQTYPVQAATGSGGAPSARNQQ